MGGGGSPGRAGSRPLKVARNWGERPRRLSQMLGTGGDRLSGAEEAAIAPEEATAGEFEKVVAPTAYGDDYSVPVPEA